MKVRFASACAQMWLVVLATVVENPSIHGQGTTAARYAWLEEEASRAEGQLVDLPAIEDASLLWDSAVAPVQMLTPQRRPGVQLAQRSQTSNTTNRETSLASVPFMIGDTGAGTCVAFGGLLDVELSHPTLTCSRLNISENNTPLPTDRLYYSYRHFHNLTKTRFFQYEQDFDVDQHTLGAERTFWDGMMSVEMRLPLSNRLTSQPFTYDVLDPPFFLDPVAFPPGFIPIGGGTRTELGNISLLFKALMMERRDYAISAGLGLTLPTAQDVDYLITTDDTLVFPSLPGVTADSSVLLDVFATNETVYLSPYLAWLCTPSERFFHQGFLQVEVAANPSSVIVAGDGLNDFYVDDVFVGTLDWQTTFPSGRGNLYAQTLMRLNLGCGYKIIDEPNTSGLLNQLAAIFEMHYTTTLQDANITSMPVFVTGSLGSIPVQSIEFGNRANRVDILNVVTGLSAKFGNWVVTNGATAPISTGTNRAFDFEYNCQVQRIF